MSSQSSQRYEAGLAIERQRRRRARQQPAEQRDKQQETQRTDDACEVSPRSHHIEISSVSHILVRRLLHIFALAIAHIRKGATACTPTACDTTSSAILPRSNPAGYSIASRAARPAYISTCRPCNHSAVATACAGKASSAHSASAIRTVHSWCEAFGCQRK